MGVNVRIPRKRRSPNMISGDDGLGPGERDETDTSTVSGKVAEEPMTPP
jgi:hypothetical protein